MITIKLYNIYAVYGWLITWIIKQVKSILLKNVYENKTFLFFILYLENDLFFKGRMGNIVHSRKGNR